MVAGWPIQPTGTHFGHGAASVQALATAASIGSVSTQPGPNIQPTGAALPFDSTARIAMVPPVTPTRQTVPAYGINSQTAPSTSSATLIVTTRPVISIT